MIDNLRTFNWHRFLLTAFSAGFLLPAVACGQLTYVDADFFSNLSASSGTLGDIVDQFNLTPANEIATDGKWRFRGDASGNMFGSGGTIYESDVMEDVNAEIIQTIDGFSSGQQVDLYAVWWSALSQNWTVRAGTSSNLGNNTLYDRTGAVGTAGQLGFLSNWSALPADNDDIDDGLTGIAGATLEGDRAMVIAKIGTATANGSGQVFAYIDDYFNPQSNFANRSWFDGVAYAPVGTNVSSLTATVNRTTGNLTVTASTDYSISAVSITSGSGSIVASAWSPITGNLDSAGNSTFDDDPWETTSSTATSLAENEIDGGAVDGGTLGPAGASTINFGNIWNSSSPFEDLTINLTINDVPFAVPVTINYTGGTAPIFGDFDADSDIDVDDYEVVLRGQNRDLAGLTDLESYPFGDVTGDQETDFDDLVRFRELYDEVNGLGAFAALVGNAVPEPSTFALLGVFVLAVSQKRRFRHCTACLVAILLLCVSTASSQAQITYIDADLQNDPSNNITVVGGNALATGNLGNWTMRGTTPLGGGTDPTFGNNGDILQALFGQEVDELQIDFTIPDAGTYDIYAFYWDATDNRFWNVAAGFNSGNLTDFNQGSPETFRVSATTQANDSPQRVTGLNVLENGATFTDDYTDGNRGLWVSRIGEQTVDANGNVTVFIDHLTEGKVNDQRTFFDGLGYAVAPPKVTLEVNTTTGAVTIRNPTGDPVDFSYYEISSAGNSLSPTGWSSLDAQNVDAEDGDDPGSTAGDSLLEGWDVAGSGPILDGDLNASGVVNAADLSAWQGGYGDTYDGNDFLNWQRDLGQSSAGEGSTDLLNEVNLLGSSNLAANTGSLSLGMAYDTTVGAEDLVFRFGSVDSTDELTVGRVSYVSSVSTLEAVPEPGSALLATFALLLTCSAKRRPLGR